MMIVTIAENMSNLGFLLFYVSVPLERKKRIDGWKHFIFMWQTFVSFVINEFTHVWWIPDIFFLTEKASTDIWAHEIQPEIQRGS